MGQSSKALPFYEQALVMTQKLYPASRFPNGHPDLANNLNSIGFLLREMGQSSMALSYYEQALAMWRRLGRQILNSSSEAEALAYVQAQPLTRDGFLSLTRTLLETEAKAYTALWSGKSVVTRVLEQRHAAARVAGTEYAELLEELKIKRRTVDDLLRDTKLPKVERDMQLTKAVDGRDALERELAKAIPLLDRAKELDALGFEALLPLLPDRTTLIDFVRYSRLEIDPARPGKAGWTRTLSYAAFVLTKGQTLRRIELGDANTIDRAVADWRGAIESRSTTQAATELRERVWAKLAPHLPSGTKALFLALDGDLARMPWAALPIAADRVAIEDYAIATVPHGLYLLDHLKYPRAFSGADTPLTLGGVDYGVGKWPALPGTAIEVKAIADVAPSGNVPLSGTNATAERLKSWLPKARYAHLATHGEFKADELSAERKRADEAMPQRPLGDETRPVAATNPLGFVGLVLANGEILSGLSVLDLPLENLRLATLSACETGLGELTGGEGVQGLQRAFHLAGCPNVIASLWKVNDAATAGLMAKFYHEMWVNKKPPIEALREAQLFIYYNPDKIPDVLGERGAPKRSEALAVKAVPAAPAKVRSKRADTKLWAAFVLSGIGK